MEGDLEETCPGSQLRNQPGSGSQQMDRQHSVPRLLREVTRIWGERVGVDHEVSWARRGRRPWSAPNMGKKSPMSHPASTDRRCLRQGGVVTTHLVAAFSFGSGLSGCGSPMARERCWAGLAS